MSNLWRVFVPSWRFFDRIGLRPRVFVRTNGDWRRTLLPPPRRWYSLIFNPAAHLHHADQNLVERLLHEITDAPDVANLVSFRLLSERLRGEGAEFKIVVNDEDVLRAELPA